MSHHELESQLHPALLHYLKHLDHRTEAILSALDNLNTAVTTLGTAVDAAVAKLGEPAVNNDPAIQAAADSVTAAAAKLTAATSPPA